jgi:CRP/FNR family cyclic AMP-dependent transcriptional regulator
VLQAISRDVHERTYQPGQVILLSGDPCEAVYLVVRGVVRARRLSLEGREYVLDYVGPGQPFNLVPALDGGVNLATGEALTQATVYLISCDRFLRLVQEQRAVAMAALRHIAGRVRYLSDTVENLALHTVRTRLARFLLSRDSNDLLPIKHWTQEEVAAHIGTVRDVVGRTLRSMAREGLIRHERGRLVVVDRNALQHEAMYE